MAGVVGNVYTGLDDFKEMCFLLHFLKCGDIFLDVGANIGSYSLLATGVCGAKSYAVEPIPTTFSYLLENVRLNHLNGSIKCFNIGLSDKKGSLVFSCNKGTMNRVVGDESIGIEVPVDTIDDFLAKQSIIPKLVKIDVEGFELPVLKGGVNMLVHRCCEAIIIELNGSGLRYGIADEDVHAILISKGFLPVDYDPFTRKLRMMFSYNKEGFNTIYVRNFDQVQNGLNAAPKVQIGKQII